MSGVDFQEGPCKQGPTSLHGILVSMSAIAVLDIPLLCAKAGGSWVLLVSWCHQQPRPLSSVHGQALRWVRKPSSALAGGMLQVPSVPLVFALTHCRVLGLVQPMATHPIAPLEEASSEDVSSIYAAFP